MRSLVFAAVLAVLATASAAASPVNSQSPDGIAASESGFDGWGLWLLSTSGEVWSYTFGSGWEHEVYMSPPVPVSQLSAWWQRFCRTTDGRWFRYQEASWEQIPPPPFAPVAAEQKSLGGAKQGYR